MYFALGVVLMKSVSLLMLPIVTRHVAPEQFGQLELLLAISDFATLVVGFGMVEALYRFAGLSDGPDHEKHIGATVFSLSLVFSAVSLVIGMLLAGPIHSMLDGPSLLDVQLLVFLFSVDACLLIPLAWLKLKEQAFSFFVLTTSKAAGQALITWWLLGEGYGITAILLGGAISSAVLALVLCKIQWQQTGLAFDRKLASQVLQYGWPLVISALAAYVLFSADRWVISVVSTPHELGLYAVSKKLAVISTLLMQPFLLWWSAVRFKQLNEPDGQTRVAKTASVGIALIICASTLVLLGSPIIMQWLIDPAYAAAMVYLPGLVLVFALKQIAEMANLGSYIGDSTWNVMAIDLICAAFALVALYVLGQWWQVHGVILAMVLAQCLRAFLFYNVSQRILKLHYSMVPLVLLSALSLAIVYAIRNLQSIPLHFAALTLTCLLFAAFMHFSGLFSLTPLLQRLGQRSPLKATVPK